MVGGMLVGWVHEACPGDFVVSLSGLDGIFWGKIGWIRVFSAIILRVVA